MRNNLAKVDGFTVEEKAGKGLDRPRIDFACHVPAILAPARVGRRCRLRPCAWPECLRLPQPGPTVGVPRISSMRRATCSANVAAASGRTRPFS